MPAPSVPSGLALDEVKGTYIKTATASHDDFLKMLLAGVHGFVARRTKRELLPFTAAGDDKIRCRVEGMTVVRVPDIRTITTITLDGSTLGAGTGYELHPHPDRGAPAPILKLFTEGELLEVEAECGFSALPWELKSAMYRHVARTFAERSAEWSDADGDQAYGEHVYARALPQEVRDTYDFFSVAADRVVIA